MMIFTSTSSLGSQLSRSKYCDIFLSTSDGMLRGETIAAHKVILASVSDILARYCETGGGKQPVVVTNIKYRVLEQIVEFIYSGRVLMEDTVNDDFLNGLRLLKLQVTVEEVVENTESSRSELDSSMLSLKKDFSTVSNSILEMDLNLSFNSNSTEEDEIVSTLNNHELVSEVKESNFEDGVKPMTLALNSSAYSTDDLSAGDDSIVGGISKSADSNFKFTHNFVKSSIDQIAPPRLNDPKRSKFVDEGYNAEHRDNEIPPRIEVEKNNNYQMANDHHLDKLVKCPKQKCGFCDVTISYSGYLSHCKRFHPEANFNERKCGVCCRGVPLCIWDYHQLVRHDATYKSKVEPVSCDFCGRLFSAVHTLRRHLKESCPKNGIDRRVPCSRCGSLLQRSNLSRHIKQGSCKTAEVTLKCDGKVFKFHSPKNACIKKIMKYFCRRVDWDTKFAQFLHKGSVILGSENAGIFDGETIQVLRGDS